jgi:hypothetical protein
MAAPKWRRTLAQYTRLFRNPRALFPGGPDDGGVHVTLWPNGVGEIWLQTGDGLGVALRASDGPHGLGLQIRAFSGTPRLTIGHGEADADTFYREIVQFRTTPTAQAARMRLTRGRD